MVKKSLLTHHHLPFLVLFIIYCPLYSLPLNILTTTNHIPISNTSSYPDIKLYLSPALTRNAQDILNETRLITTLYHIWFGPSPAPEFTVVDAGMTNHPAVLLGNLITVDHKPVPFTRLFQRHLATRIARFWFDSEKGADPFLTDGLPAYAATRYLEAVYGDENLLNLPVSVPFTDNFSDRYLHQFYYYAAATNNLSRSLTEPVAITDPFVYDAVYKSQTVLLLRALESELGTSVLDSAIRLFRFNSAKTTPAFLACLSAVAGPEKEIIINRIFGQDGKNDLKITRVRQQAADVVIDLSASTPVNLPVELKTVFTDNSYRIDTVLFDRKTRIAFATERKVRQVILDPERKILESDRWNNIFPRQIKIKPIFNLPDFESYQIFYGPWFWYDNYRGFQPGIWFQGRKMIDAGPVRGEHNWTLIQNYASNKSDWHTGISYQTPLFFYPSRLRLYLTGDNSFLDRGIKAYLTNEFGPPFRLPKNEIQFGYRLYELFDTTGRDPRAWSPARIAELRARLYRATKKSRLSAKHELNIAQGLKPLLSRYQYTKISLEENITISPISLRIFAGTINGSFPPQEAFYLSGGLTNNNTEPVSWAYKGMASGQEHWHYDGDANCRGYYGLYRHGRVAYGVNIHLVCNRYILPFLDLGNVGDSLNQPGFFHPLIDAGIRIKLGPLYADFPFYKSAPEPAEKHLAFRWSLGFKLTELLSKQ
ncbi:MAG: hypothetical protein ACUVUR_07560 [bacterium]